MSHGASEPGRRGGGAGEYTRRDMGWDVGASFGAGLVALLLFHLDHLIVTYSGWDDPWWWLHVGVDSGYVLLYGGLFFVMIRGWRVWRRSR